MAAVKPMLIHKRRLSNIRALSKYNHVCDLKLRILLFGSQDPVLLDSRANLLDKYTEDTYTLKSSVAYKTITFEDKKIRLEIHNYDSTTLPETTDDEYHALILLYDTSSEDSFKFIQSQWFNAIENESKLTTIETLLIGNTYNNDTERIIDASMGQSFANENGMKFMSTSSYIANSDGGNNISEAFLTIIEPLKHRLLDGRNDNNNDDHVDVDYEVKSDQIKDDEKIDEKKEEKKKDSCVIM